MKRIVYYILILLIIIPLIFCKKIEEVPEIKEVKESIIKENFLYHEIVEIEEKNIKVVGNDTAFLLIFNRTEGDTIIRYNIHTYKKIYNVVDVCDELAITFEVKNN